MENIYPIFLTIHLLCAIVFLGFIFCDIVLLSVIKKTVSETALQAMMKRAIKIMPLCVLLLVITGGAMMTRYLSFRIGLEGFFGTPLQSFLSIKIILALVIVCLVINALTHKFILKRENFLAAYTHKIVFVLGFFIVVLAKLAFFV